jgi:uncharacterized BrkB/YihY/UPF0761 family membrane protein
VERAAERAQRKRWARTLVDSFEREQESGAALLAGGLAYRLFFWLVPFGLVVAAIASFWERSDRGSLTDAARSFGLSGVAARSAVSAVHGGSHGRWYLLITGIVLLFYFGLGAVRALRVAAFIGWRIKPTRLRRPFRASATFSALVILALTATMATSWLREHTPGIGFAVTAGVLLVFMALATYAFRLLPHAEGVRWQSHLPGGAVVACGVTGIHLFTVYYLAGKLERSPKLYGTLGAATVVLLGLFLVARVVVSALFLNATLSRRSGDAQPADFIQLG